MRFPLAFRVVPFVCLASSLLLAGCGMGTHDTSLTSSALAGKAHGTVFGGQQPVKNSVLTVYSVGVTSYGTGATALASTTTDANGSFQFGTTADNSYTCDSSDPLVYIVARGGDAGSGVNNDSIELVAPLQDCLAAQQTIVNINEVTTAATATIMSHFFSAAVGSSVAPNLGAPNSGSNPANHNLGLANAFANMGALVNVTSGNATTNYTAPAASGGTMNSIVVTTESAKLNSFANTLAACVNTSGTTGNTDTTSICAQLFANSAYKGSSPATTFQAALYMALYPFNNTAALFGLASTASPFPGLATAPKDWTLANSYTYAGYGLGVEDGSSVSMDISSNGTAFVPANLFPGNAVNTGAISIQTSGTSLTSAAHAFTGITHPQYLALDNSTETNLWVTDQGSENVGKFNQSTLDATTYAATYATGGPIFINAANDAVFTGTTNASSNVYYVASDEAVINPIASTPFTGMPADIVGDGTIAREPVFAATSNGACNLEELNGTADTVLVTSSTSNCDAAGIVKASTASLAASYVAAASTANELCITGVGCNAYTSLNAPKGVALDGDGNLWIANSGDSSVAMFAPTPTTQNTYTAMQVSPVAYAHGIGNGGTMTMPYGIAVDATGNVWVANAGCVSLSVTDCAPGNLVVTLMFGAGAPTITPKIAAAQQAHASRPQQ